MQPTAATVRPDTLPPQHIQISDVERQSGNLSAEHRGLATFLLRTRGYVILRNAMSLSFHAKLREGFERVLRDCQATLDRTETDASPEAEHHVSYGRETGAAFWFRRARWRVFPKLEQVFGDRQLLANPLVLPILGDLLGPGFGCRYVTSDTCLKGSILQSPHSDILMNDAFVDNTWKARGYIVNVPVTECGLHNGPMEVWPGGSHLWTSAMMDAHGLHPYVQDARNPAVERLTEYLPSIKVAFVPGDILIRDLSMWHRGTPNPTDEPRTMMTMGYFRQGYEYGYADPRYNVDRQLYGQLSSDVQPLFAHYFTWKKVLRRQQRALEAQSRALLSKLRG